MDTRWQNHKILDHLLTNSLYMVYMTFGSEHDHEVCIDQA